MTNYTITKRLLPIILLAVTFCQVFIQKNNAQEHSLIPFYLSDELKLSEVNSIVQDASGFLWLGTWKGIYRFDGINLINYSLEKNGKPGFRISKLFVDKHDRIWVGTYNEGISVIDNNLGKIVRYDSIGNTPTGYVNGFYEDENGNLWIGSTSGLFFSNFDKGYLEHFPIELENENKKIINCDVISILAMPRNDLWLGTNMGLIRYSGTQRVQKRFSTAIFDYVGTLEITGDTLWAGHKRGMHIINIRSGKTEEIIELKNHYVTNISTTRPNSSILRLGTSKGLYNFHTITKSLSFIPLNIAGESKKTYNVITTFKERGGLLITGTDHGLFLFDENRIKITNYFNENVFQSISSMAQSNNKIFVASWGEGLLVSKIDGTTLNRFEKIVIDRTKEYTSNIYCLAYDNNNNLWVATKGAGVYKLSFKAQNIQPHNIESFNEETGKGIDANYVMSLYATPNGSIWAGEWYGNIYNYSPKAAKFSRYNHISGQSPFINFPVNKIQALSDSLLLIATYGKGLFLVKTNDNNKTYSVVFSYPNHANKEKDLNRFISDACTDMDGNIYFTPEFGLVRINAKTYESRSYSKGNGLTGNFIYSLQFDTLNNLWISTDAGISRLTFSNDSLIAAKNFTVHDGIYKTVYSARSSILLNNGAIGFGGANGFTILKPEPNNTFAVSSNTVITGIKIFDENLVPGIKYNGRLILKKPIYNTSDIFLKHNENFISLSFSAMNYASAGNYTFLYKLDGYEQNWNHADYKSPLAVYKNIPPGTYRFLIKTESVSSAFKSNITGLTITISPPWYKSHWAYTAYILIVLAALLAIYKFIRFKHKLELEHLSYKKDIALYEMKLHFFTSISHEFRTPITVILAIVRQLIQKIGTNNSQIEEYSRIDRNAVMLKHLVDDILDQSSIEKEAFKLKKEEFNLLPFLEDLSESISYLFIQKNISFEFKYNSKHQYLINADRQRLESVYYNLLSNAAKFTATGGKITVELDKTFQETAKKTFLFFIKNDDKKPESQISICVSDTGMGIAKNELEHIFENYYTGSNYEKNYTNLTGTGIGLPLVKKIIELHNGVINVESKENEGSSFTVLIPDTIPEQNQEAMPQVSEIKVSKAYIPEIKVEEELTLEKFKAGKRIILVVDDNEDIRSIIKQCLEEQYSIIEANNGLEGYEAAQKYIPDLIILDILMPELNGRQVCEKIKTNDKTDHIPVIMLTALNSEKDKFEGIKTGADTYMAKPFDPEMLLIRVEKLIETRERLRKKYTRNLMVENQAPAIEPAYDPTDAFIQKVRIIIEDNISDPEFSVADLAKNIGMSQMQLFRKLKTTIDITANRFIRLVRLRKAKELLESGHMNVSEVTFAVGYNDLRYFRNSFKEEFGINPSELLRDNGNGEKEDESE